MSKYESTWVIENFDYYRQAWLSRLSINMPTLASKIVVTL